MSNSEKQGPIVVITIEGELKKEFVNSLHEKTGGAVALVIIQRRPTNTFWSRVKELFRKNRGLRALFFVLLLCLNFRARRRLRYFRERTPSVKKKTGWIPRVVRVTSVNDDAVYKEISALAPSLIVVWGSGILQSRIVRTAKNTINLHLGLAPYYRGAVGNQFAVFCDDAKRIGATLHHVDHEADAGDIIETIQPDLTLPPRELFWDLNDRATERFCDIAVRLHRGETPPRRRQEVGVGKTYLLKQWTPEIRYKVGRKIAVWERTGQAPRKS